MVKDYSKEVILAKKYFDVFSKESNVAVYLLLGIYGQMAPNELIKYSKYGKATIFRSLGDLSESGLISSDIDKKETDKRKNKVYFIIKELDDFPAFTEEFIKYCIDHSQTDLLKNIFIFTRTFVLSSMKVSMDLLQYEREKKIDQDYFNSINAKGIFSFFVKDIEDHTPIIEKAREFINNITDIKEIKAKKTRDPLKNPIAVSIGVFPIKSREKRN